MHRFWDWPRTESKTCTYQKTCNDKHDKINDEEDFANCFQTGECERGLTNDYRNCTSRHGASKPVPVCKISEMHLNIGNRCKASSEFCLWRTKWSDARVVSIHDDGLDYVEQHFLHPFRSPWLSPMIDIFEGSKRKFVELTIGFAGERVFVDICHFFTRNIIHWIPSSRLE